MRKILAAMLGAAIACTPAIAAPYYVRGDFNGWSGTADELVDQGGGLWTYTVTGLTPGSAYEYKATVDDWSFNAPGSNAKTVADGAGEINVNFFPSTSWADGWEPSAKARLGWADPGTFDWEIAGDMNGWNGGASWFLTDQGNGLHSATIAMSAGTYSFKFRQQGSWDYSTGDDLGNAASNNNITVANNGDLWKFELDLPNGRWHAVNVPEPATLTMLVLGGLLAARRRR